MITNASYRLRILLLLLSLITGSAYAQTAIFHANTSAQPGEAISLQGQFSASAQAYLAASGTNGGQFLPIAVQSAGQLTAQLPTNLSPDMYQIWVMDQGQRSNSIYINQARGFHFDSPDVAPGGTLRLFGRNLLLDGRTPQVRFSAQNGGSGGGSAKAQAIDAYTLLITAPSTLTPGQTYDVFVSNGFGGTIGETQVEQAVTAATTGADYFQLGVAWASKLNFYQNVYNVRTDSRLSQKAVGDGVANDLPALQAAVNQASADGGGIVYVPAGLYNMVANTGVGLFMRNRVVIQGAGKGVTTLRYGYGSTAAGWDPGSHWGVIWNGVTQSGLADLSLLNVDNTGNYYNNMSGRGTEIFMQRVRYDLNLGAWIWLSNSNKLLISNSDITQGVDAKAGYHGIVQLNGCQDFVISRNNFTYAVDGLNLNYTNRGVFEDNHIYRDGSARWASTLNLVNHVLIMNFAENVAVLRNEFKVINGVAQNAFDGETILAEGGGATRPDEDAGTVSYADANTVQDYTKSWPAIQQHPVIAIIKGPGMGQWRRIASRNANTITVDKPWDVIPQAGSNYAIFNWGSRNWLVQDNIMQDNIRGITIYHNGTNNVAIVGNKLTNNGSIDLTPVQQINTNGIAHQQFNPYYDNQIIGNEVSNTNGSNGVLIGVHSVQYLQNKSMGTSVIGLEVRRNTLTAGQPNVLAYVDDYLPEGYMNGLHYQQPTSYIDDQTPVVLGSIFQDNTAINCDNALNINSGAYNTLVCNMRLINSPNAIKDSRVNGAAKTSTNTASCQATVAPAIAPPTTIAPVAPIARPTNTAPKVDAGLDRTVYLTGGKLRLPDYTVQLTATATDADGYIASLQWKQKSGPNQATNMPSKDVSLFVNNLVQGTYVFSVTATDDGGLSSSADVVINVATQNAPNIAPKVDAGLDQTVYLPIGKPRISDYTVQLTATATDADGSIASLQWTQQSGPSQVTNVPSKDVSLFVNGLVQGTYVFTVTVTDDGGLTSSDDVYVYVVRGNGTRGSMAVVSTDASLPLVQLGAEVIGLDVALTWQTALEKDNDYFAIERSTDATQFTTVGRVAAKGVAAAYNFTDSKVGAQQQGIVYYRLRQVDTSGKATYSTVQSVSFGSEAVAVQVYPNPATTELHTLLPAAGAHFTVYTSAGQQVQEARTTSTEAVLNVQNLPTGLYLMQIQLANGSNVYHRFTKE